MDAWSGAVKSQGQLLHAAPDEGTVHAVVDLDPFCLQEPFSDSERSATLPPSVDSMAAVSTQ